MEPLNANFRVVIVGGSVAGLTLAHCLLRNNIDFVVLESHAEIAPQVGASIGILPNGARIIDQLGIYDDVLDAVEPLRRAFTWSDAATCITDTDSPLTLHNRHGYPTAFLDRQILLAILYEHLKDGRARVLVNKKVTKVEHLAQKVVVHCADDSIYEGDVVVGADGVRSTVREQMWRYMESQGLGEEALQERSLMTSEYDCVFGISTATPGLTPGEVHRTFAEGYSLLTIIGKEGRVFWFFFTKMSQKYATSDIPRYSQNDIDDHVTPYLQKPITQDVAFVEVYQRAIVRTFVALEEAVYQRWSLDRYVCIGDSAHKMTPNLGQGGNSAIESAASLANSLSALVHGSRKTIIGVKDIHHCLQQWEYGRRKRVEDIAHSAHKLTRLEALAGTKQKLIGLYLLPYLTSYLIDISSATIVEAAKLDCEPLPLKSLQCSMPYKGVESHSVNKEDQRWNRILSTAPLLGCYYAAQATMGTLLTQVKPLMVPLLMQGTWTASNGESLSLHRPVYHLPPLDNLLRPFITCFLPSISGSDPQSRLQMLSFMTDLGPVYGIWLLESYRQAHSWREILLPVTFGIAFQLKGIGKLAPIYYALEHIRTPLSKLRSGSKYQVESEVSSSLLAAMLAGYYVPTFANFLAPAVESRRWYNAVWQLFPVIIPVLQGSVGLLGKGRSKRPEPPEQARKNMRTVRYAYRTFALVSGLTFIYARLSVPAGVSFASVFLPGLRGHLEPVTSFTGGIARFLQYDELISMASGFAWLALKFRELRQAGAQFSWWKAIGGLLGTTCTFGPGAAFALGWGWREEILNRMA
ncbi:hypothetical protein BDV26DRAFT_199127 [Aspergillus bertholletiae]|uniref:FAD-binding domain-containing protein n=1 Tax=Aspergillus bertholletiae TaxID=1226010 RepID=A0A5N7B8E0_9EURO|nr:hypothetical protein BDV26DRAFT_199127 [Aspergillus bertholletiae]